MNTAGTNSLGEVSTLRLALFQCFGGPSVVENIVVVTTIGVPSCIMQLNKLFERVSKMNSSATML